MTDAELVNETLAGTTSAFETLIARWSLRLLAYAQGSVACRATAEDIVQESFLRAYRQLASLERPEKFGPWLLCIAHRLILDAHKAKRTTIQLRAEFDVDHLPAEERNHRQHVSISREPVARSQDNDEECQELMRQVNVLPPLLRQAILIYYFDKITYSEMASLLGVSKATINARLTQARALLRERISEIRSDR